MDLSCRICLDNGERKDFIAPCKCNGTSKWVHRQCLDKWRSMKEDKAFSKCTECLAPYKLVAAHEDSCKQRCWRHSLFSFLVTRDVFLGLLLWQLLVCFFGLVVYTLDLHSGLISYFSLQGNALVFYYIAGCILFFTVVGVSHVMCGSCLSSCSGDSNNSNSPCSWWLFDDGVNYRSPQFYCYACPLDCYPGPGGGSCCCCAEDSSSAFGCMNCAECGHEALIIVAAIMVIFALLGLFVCVALGAAYISYLFQRHVHVLRKWTLAQEFLVADLAAPGYANEVYCREGNGNDSNCYTTHSTSATINSCTAGDDNSYINSTAFSQQGPTEGSSSQRPVWFPSSAPTAPVYQPLASQDHSEAVPVLSPFSSRYHTDRLGHHPKPMAMEEYMEEERQRQGDRDTGLLALELTRRHRFEDNPGNNRNSDIEEGRGFDMYREGEGEGARVGDGDGDGDGDSHTQISDSHRHYRRALGEADEESGYLPSAPSLTHDQIKILQAAGLL